MGGPATDVRWTKNNFTVVADGELYEHSQVVINTTSGTYENRLRIVNKSSKVAGTYTCQVGNVRGSVSKSFHLEGMYSSNRNITYLVISLQLFCFSVQRYGDKTQ